jgi:hypothetical protein
MHLAAADRAEVMPTSKRDFRTASAELALALAAFATLCVVVLTVAPQSA